MLRKLFVSFLDKVIELALRLREFLAPSPIEVLLDSMTPEERRAFREGLIRDVEWAGVASKTTGHTVLVTRRMA